MDKFKNRIMAILIISVSIIGIYSLIRFFYLKDINTSKLDVKKYIEYVDDISENKVQVNWKYVCSITAIMNNNNFNKISESDIKKVASMFINEENKLKPVEDVIKELNLNGIKTKRVYNYIDDLKNYGIRASNLSENSKYIKFINTIKEGAINNYKKYKVLPSITIAQAILETGWGDSELSSKYNNLFGIKADSSWTGEYVTLETKEFSNTIINDKFRVYDDKEDSINDHGKFLYENIRYKKYGVFDANTYIYQANALEDAGYSTHMNAEGEKIYARQLIQLIQQYNLQLIDSEVQSNLHS